MLVKTSATPLLQVIGAYAAKDCAGALLTFPVSSGTQGPTSATIKRLTITDADAENEILSLHLFTGSPAAAARTDDAECVQVAADLLLKIVTLPIVAADYQVFAGDSIATTELDTDIIFDGENLYGVIELAGTPTWTAADDLIVYLLLEV
jgi:hypothetical protein